MVTFFDTHAHLDYPDFAKEMPDIIARARTAGIERIISIATNLESSRRAIQLADQHPEVYATIGWHPGEVMDAPEDIRGELLDLGTHPKVVAIGETGLDYYRLPSQQPGGTAEADARYKAKQAAIFEQQLEVACQLGLNVVIHQRDSLEATVSQFTPYAGRIRAVFHCFVSEPATMQRILDMGSIVSFTGIATFKNAQTVRDTIAATPMGRFMLETDSPYLAPVPYRGKRCEPAYVRETAALVAQVKGCTAEELSEATCATARSFFPKLR